MHQPPVPTEKGLRCDQEGWPGWSRQAAAERRQQQPIAGLPARTPDLAVKNAELTAEEEHLEAEAAVGAAADEGEIEKEA